MADEQFDVRTPARRILDWFGAPESYQLTRWLILRLLGVVYVFAFLGLLFQGPALLGSHGLTPVASYVAQLREAGQGFWDVPSLFMLSPNDGALQGWAVVGLILSLALVAGYANMPSLLLLWFIYGSYERVGQLWFSFGWEIQILETTVLAAFLVAGAGPWAGPRSWRIRGTRGRSRRASRPCSRSCSCAGSCSASCSVPVSSSCAAMRAGPS